MNTLGCNIINGNKAIDDRGIVSFVNDFDFKNVKRFYQVQNHSKNFIRAWHGHVHEGKYVYVPKGSILIGAVEMPSLSHSDDLGQNVNKEAAPKKFILSSEKPSILYIPPNHANGFMTLTDDTVVIFFSTSTLEESKNDDIRFEYNKWDIWNIEYR